MGWFSEAKPTGTPGAPVTPQKATSLTPVQLLCKSLVEFPAEWAEQEVDSVGESALRHSSGAGIAWENQEDSRGDHETAKVWVTAHGDAWLSVSEYDSELIEAAIIKNAALRVSGYKPPFAITDEGEQP